MNTEQQHPINDNPSPDFDRVSIRTGYTRIGTLICDPQDTCALHEKVLSIQRGLPMAGELPAVMAVAQLMVGHDGGAGQHYGAKVINGDECDVRRCNVQIMFVPKYKKTRVKKAVWK